MNQPLTQHELFFQASSAVKRQERVKDPDVSSISAADSSGLTLLTNLEGSVKVQKKFWQTLSTTTSENEILVMRKLKLKIVPYFLDIVKVREGEGFGRDCGNC